MRDVGRESVPVWNQAMLNVFIFFSIWKSSPAPKKALCVPQSIDAELPKMNEVWCVNIYINAIGQADMSSLIKCAQVLKCEWAKVAQERLSMLCKGEENNKAEVSAEQRIFTCTAV